jgi:hypothetical protein
MNRRLVLVLVVVAFVAAGWASDGNIGASSECINRRCDVSASSSWLAVFTAFGLTGFMSFYPQRRCPGDPSRIVGVWRRVGSFLVDFTFVLMIVAPLAALPILAVEAEYAETFQWSFAREYPRPTDWLLFTSGALAGFAALFLYFYQHERLGRPTVGQYVLGYRVVPTSDGKPNYALRVLLSFVGLCIWPVSMILASRNSHKAFWWDGATGTKVVACCQLTNRCAGRVRDKVPSSDAGARAAQLNRRPLC